MAWEIKVIDPTYIEILKVLYIQVGSGMYIKLMFILSHTYMSDLFASMAFTSSCVKVSGIIGYGVISKPLEHFFLNGINVYFGSLVLT